MVSFVSNIKGCSIVLICVNFVHTIVGDGSKLCFIKLWKPSSSDIVNLGCLCDHLVTRYSNSLRLLRVISSILFDGILNVVSSSSPII